MTAWVLDKEGNRVLAQDERETVVCTLNGSCRNPDVLKDARMIVAAPAMLEALKRIAAAKSDGLDHERDVIVLERAIAIAQRVIAIATGG